MTDLSAELVQRLARRKGTGQPVLSLYLSIDGREMIKPEEYRLRLEALLRKVAVQHDGTPGVSEILERVRTFFAEDLSRKDIPAIAVFCDSSDLWEVVPLTVAVEDSIALNSTPHVRRLETILDAHESMGVLLTDRQHARLLIIELDRVTERRELTDPLPRHDDDKGDWGKDHVKAHSNVFGTAHIKHAAQAMFELFQQHPFSRLLVCTTDELAPELDRHLHSYLKAKLVGHCNLPVNSNDDKILATVREVSAKAERQTESIYVDRLRAGVAANLAAGRTNGNSTGAVAGIDKTLDAVFEKRVETLLVSEGFVTEGWRCEGCSYIATLGKRCKKCGEDMTLVEDVVEEAVEDALSQKCRVEFCSENADLDVLGRIGALLRF